jgi:hypothetical protein
MTLRLHPILLISLACVAAAFATAQTQPSSSAPASPAPSTPSQLAPDAARAERGQEDEESEPLVELTRVQAAWQSRLESLRPSDPDAYFLLAEEVADAAPSDLASRQLAARLYILAMNLDLARNPTRPALAASACVALADLDYGSGEATWLLALAQRLDPRQTRPAWLTQPASSAPDSVQYRLATALGMIRAGEGIQAKRILADRAVEPSFRTLDRTLRRMTTLSNRDLLREASRWPCPECANQRVVRRLGVSPPEYRICSNCDGTPGPDLSTFQLIEYLRIESYLLDVGQRSWGAQTLVDGGAPIVDPEPDSVAKAFSVDPTLTLFRNGTWIAPAGTAQPSPRANAPAASVPVSPTESTNPGEPANPANPNAVPVEP